MNKNQKDTQAKGVVSQPTKSGIRLFEEMGLKLYVPQRGKRKTKQ
ncbi:Uncharacterised protein [Burkholderia pseudomallei]|nr:hypothetical protein [Burkholderia pseudomallei]CAK1331501.1 Uncharacterised protein [Burkholderia pseudomallei]